MPGDNPGAVAAGSNVEFPRDGPAGGGIARVNASEFVLPVLGTYRVAFSVSVTQAGQLVLALNSGGGMTELAYTLYGRAAGTSEISGEALVTTTVVDAVIELRNPEGAPLALTVTPEAGGSQPSVASVVIQQLD